MKSYIHLYKTYSEFTESYNGPDYDEPWLSLTEENMEVNYNKPSKELTAITFDSITWVTDMPATGGTATKDNCTFKVYANYDNGTSVDISSDATVEGELIVPSSTEGQRHEAGQLTLTASYSGFTATGNVTVYQEASSSDFSKEPLTFNILSAGTINWTASNTDVAKTIEYKLNDGEWISITYQTGSSAPSIEVNTGNKIQFRGNNAQYANNYWERNSFGGSASFEVEGNIMSLIYGDNFKNNSTISSTHTFVGLFNDCTKLVSAENLVLPATTLTKMCYEYMFKGCASLTTAPELPATTLVDDCYEHMFAGCTSLTTAPELPATTLASGCYQYMFQGCTSLTTAPSILPATELTDSCYESMFNGCTSLTTAPVLPATTLADYCYQYMFNGCTKLTTAPELPATTLADYCYRYMFYGCTSLTTAPELPATTLAYYCYQSMFYGCTSLTTAPELPATTLKSNCYQYMFEDCTSLTTAPELPATTLTKMCYEYMFKGCASLTTAPELPATTLASGCYNSMFAGCTKLNYIKCLATDISASSCTSGWVSGVAPTGTFVKNPDMASWTTGDSGIPTGWTVEENADYTKEPLTFNILSAGTINWKASNTAITKTIEYKLNDNEWASITSNTGSSAASIAVNSGDKLQFKGNNSQYANNYWERNSFGGSTASFEVEGNIMSLIYGDDFKNNSTISSASTFIGLFGDCTKLVSAENLILPATTLTRMCYQYMFYGCKSLTTAPDLPATTLADDCYEHMFKGCTSLTTAPALPATKLKTNCYGNMFYGCTSLTTAPELPVTTLAPRCYSKMFAGCTSLTTAPALPATTLAERCYEYMFQGCTSLTTVPSILPVTNLTNKYCYSNMFNGCTSLTTAPELPATTLAEGCYSDMFAGCTSLTAAPVLPAITLVGGCYAGMFNGCTSLNYIKCLATDISTSSCTSSWVSNVAETGIFVKASSMNNWTTGDSGIPSGWTVEGNADYTEEPLTFNILSAGTINWTASNSSVTKTIDYKLNDGGWTSITSNTGSSAPTITVNYGDKLPFRGNNSQYCNGYSKYNSFSGSTALFEAEGNIMSLIYGDNFKNNLTISSASTFEGLFQQCTNLVSAENLILPATDLVIYCYESMFNGCTSLTTAPVLPATTLTYYCYRYMFEGCTSLTTAPELPATTLAGYCYNAMFNGCTSLTTAPVLPATNLEYNCYQYMFQGCTSLTKAPELPATTLAEYCYSNMFKGCTSLTTAPELPATTLTEDCYKSMFQGCTSLTKVPALPATTLTTSPELPATNCYNSMFAGCTSLTTAPELPATTLADYCYSNMFAGCTSLTTAPKKLPATTLKEGCYDSMFAGCTSLTTAPELPASTLEYGCYQYMFTGCASLTTAPVLPAITLVGGCYEYMFYGCTKLNYIKCLATDISAYGTINWVEGVAETGTFVKASSMTSWSTGVDGIPTGWTVEGNVDYTEEPLTFNILSAGTINWTASNTDAAKTIEYKLNDGEWTSITYQTGSSAPSIEVNSSDKLQFRGNNSQYASNYSKYNSFGGSALFEAEGNIMSLIYGDDFKNNLTISSTYAFYSLFSGCVNLVSAENLVLPATDLTNSCYSNMFEGCTSLTTAPKKLPATTLTDSCYYNMFKDCTSLITAPELLATTLATYCCEFMFAGCTSLTTAPSILPATTLAEGCYGYMFAGCTSLTTAPVLSATNLASDCYAYMFNGCTSLTTAPELPATTLTDGCYAGMFNGCTSLTTAPELLATTLAYGCYKNMFNGCKKLNYIKCLATDISEYDCTTNWVKGVASTGTFVKASSMTSWTEGNNGIPTGWTIQDAS